VAIPTRRRLASADAVLDVVDSDDDREAVADAAVAVLHPIVTDPIGTAPGVDLALAVGRSHE